MVVIRLTRGGAKKRPFFNVVVADRAIHAMAASSSAWAFMTRRHRRAGVAAFCWSAHALAGQGREVSDTVARLVRRFGAKSRSPQT